MAGTIHGLVNAKIDVASIRFDAARDAFAIIAAFFDHLCTAGGGNYMTRIASYWGTGGTGFDRTGGANPSGENAFGVWVLHTSAARPGGGTKLGAIYFFLAWVDTEPPAGWQLNSGTADGVGLAGAFLEDGNSPWNGTTVDDGTDTKGSPLWVAGGSTVHFTERSNAPGGVDATLANNARSPIGDKQSSTLSDQYLHCIADADQFAIIGTAGVTSYGSQFGCYLMGLYSVVSNVDAAADYALFCIYDGSLPLGFDYVYGVIAGSGTLGGGVTWPDNSQDGLRISPALSYIMSTTEQPNVWSAGGAVFDESAIQLFSTGMVGYIDPFFRLAYNITNEAWDATNERFAVGTVNQDQYKLTIPWPTTVGEAPGATRTPDGVTF